MKTKVHTIAGKMESYWVSDANAMLDVVTSFSLTLNDFKEAILTKGIAHSKANNGHAWIVDSSTAKGAFSPEIQAFIGTDVFPAFAKAGIKYFVTILPKESALTRMTVKNFSSKVGPNGIKLVEVESVDDAIQFLKENK